MTDLPSVRYAREPDLDVAAFRHVLAESGLGAIRPIDDTPRLQHMLDEADLVVTARRAEDDVLLGVARSITDFSWCCYLSELAVSRSAQGLGIGRGLLDETRRQVGPKVSVILGSVPEAVGFYEGIGMPRMPDAFWYKRER
ncbi:MAG: GNAT family N-acetyltransferase [Pseudomonadota bacterium]